MIRGCKSVCLFNYRFSLIKEHLVEFNQLAMANAEGSDNMLNRVMPKDNIGLAALLKTKEAAWDNGEYISQPLFK
jgi:CCR4-NOT transcription complex subunit 6